MPKILKLLLLFVVVLIVAMFAAQPLIGWYLAPSGDVAKLNGRSSLDYKAMDLWAAHPSKDSSAMVTPQGVSSVDQVTAAADVFFIHPTTYFGPGTWNSNVAHDGFDKQGVEHLIATAASTFNVCCAIYTPHYRQAHIAAFTTDDRNAGEAALDFAYQDVEDAFAEFLAQREAGRPFFIAGHSQGSLHGARLIYSKIANTDLAEHMVAAYLIGYWFRPDTFTRILPSTPLCQHYNDTGCTVTYDSYDNTGPGRLNDLALPHWYPQGWEWTADKAGSCINPLGWHQDDDLEAAQKNLGGIGWQGSFSLINLLTNNNTGFTYQTLGEPVEELTSAQCGRQNILLVDTQEGTSFDNPGKGVDKSLHPKDWNLFYMNLRQNIADRLASYEAAVIQ